MERDSDIAKDQDARTDQYRERNIGTAAIVEAFDRVAVKREAKVPLGQSPLFLLSCRIRLERALGCWEW